tara:strand:- start:530 stop:859 length:330 start_codon:yes stop_codon:yes gene_type:complete
MNLSKENDETENMTVSDVAAVDSLIIGSCVFVIVYLIAVIITTIFASKAVTNFNTTENYTFKDLTIASIIIMWVTPFSFIGFISSIVFAIIGNNMMNCKGPCLSHCYKK